MPMVFSRVLFDGLFIGFQGHLNTAVPDGMNPHLITGCMSPKHLRIQRFLAHVSDTVIIGIIHILPDVDMLISSNI